MKIKLLIRKDHVQFEAVWLQRTSFALLKAGHQLVPTCGEADLCIAVLHTCIHPISDSRATEDDIAGTVLSGVLQDCRSKTAVIAWTTNGDWREARSLFSLGFNDHAGYVEGRKVIPVVENFAQRRNI